MAYESLIEDSDIIQGDSSDVFMFSIDDTALPVEFEASFTVLTAFGTSPLIERVLPKNDGTEGSIPGSQFVFQLLPAETAILTPGQKYIVSVEIRNPSINYNQEVAQFKLKILNQGVV